MAGEIWYNLTMALLQGVPLTKGRPIKTLQKMFTIKLLKKKVWFSESSYFDRIDNIYHKETTGNVISRRK